MAGKYCGVIIVGFDASGGYFASLFQNDPHSAFFGDLIFGNFSKADRAKLLEYVHQHNVYQVDKSKTQHKQYKGQNVVVYDVTENKDALKGFNKFVGKTIGLPDSQLNQDMQSMHFVGSVKVYVSVSTKQFVRIEAGSESINYKGYGTTKVGSAPKPQITFEQFENIVLSQPPGASSN